MQLVRSLFQSWKEFNKLLVIDECLDLIRSKNCWEFFEIFSKKSIQSDFGTIESGVLNYPRKTKKNTEMYFLEKILEPDCTKKVALLYGYFSQNLVNEFVFSFWSI